MQLIRAAGIKIWEKENRAGPAGEDKMPLTPPDWIANSEEGRRNMNCYRSLIIKGIREAVPRTSNAELAFDTQQEKDETPNAWLDRLRQNFQLYSSVDPQSPEGQVLVKIQFVTKAWPDIGRQLEKVEDWQEKGLNELLREAQKVYLRRAEEKMKSKARSMVAIARESQDRDREELREIEKAKREETRGHNTDSWEGRCFDCAEKGHFGKDCRKWRRDRRLYRETEIGVNDD